MNCAPARIAESPLSKRLESEVLRLATTPRSTISVVGPIGVGKQAWARRLHAESARASAPFVVVEPGEAVDAAAIAAAHGGTLYLREVAHLAPGSHAALAELLAQGDPDTARVVAASRRPLEAAVEAGALPEDLEYRLNVLTLEVAPLSERLGELGALAGHFLERLAPALGLATPAGLTEEATADLAARDWPTGLHGLSWVLSGALLARLRDGNWGSSDPLTAAEFIPNDQLAPQQPGASPQGSLEALEEAAVRRALEAHGGNRSSAARELGIHRTTLYQKMRRYGLS